MASITTHKSNGDKAGESPKILCEMLRYLGHQERRPLYQGFKEVVNDREEWRVEVLIDTKNPNKPLIFEAACRRATFHAGIRDAACQAMYRLRDMYADDLSHTPYHYFPRRRICNTDKEIHCYKKQQQHHHHLDLALIQQIRFTKALGAVCDDALEELREARCKVRELEEELRKAPRHKHKAIDNASSPPPLQRVIVGDKKPYQSPRHKAVTTAASAPRTRTSVVVGNTNRRACLSLQRKHASTRSQRGAAPAPCCRRLEGGVVNEDSIPSFGGGGSSAHQLPQGQGDGYCAPIASTPKSFLMHPVRVPVSVSVTVEGPHRDGMSASSSLSFEGRMHGGSNLMVAAAEGPRRDGALAASSSFESRMHGKNLMPIIIDGGVALGKDSAANANSSDDDASTSEPPFFWENMEKPCSCSSAARRRRLL